jgi:hypothetical protein
VDPGGLPPFDEAACGLPRVTPDVTPRLAVTGVTNNAVVVDGEAVWVVHSGDNTVGRLDVSSGVFDRGFIDTGDGRNPWALASDGARLWISNYATSTVTVARRSDGAVLGEVAIEAVAPSGIVAAGGLVLVASSGFVGPEFGPSGVVVLRALEEAPWLEPLGFLPSPARNASSLTVDPARGRVYVVYTGARGFDPATGDVIVTSDGAVEVLDLAALQAGELDKAVLLHLPLRRDPSDPFSGGPRSLQLSADGRWGYLPSASSPAIYKLDLERLVWARDASDPIPGYVGAGNQLTALAMRGDGLAWVVAYNQDAAYLLDTSCDATVAGPFDLGETPLLEGALDIAWDEATQQGWVILSVSSGLAQVRDSSR